MTGPPHDTLERELCLVLPVYNEGERSVQTVHDWLDILDRIELDYEVRVYDDGSSDDGPAHLEAAVAAHPRVRLLEHPGRANHGHGPTLLRGYAEARATWVFQADSDGEVPAAAFPALWDRRQAADLLLGVRSVPHPSFARSLVSRSAVALVHLLFGARLHDVNVPFRLLRRSLLEDCLPFVPPRTFAPNVALAGLAVLRGWRVLELPVPAERRARGSGRLVGLRLWRSCTRAAFETLRIARTARRSRFAGADRHDG